MQTVEEFKKGLIAAYKFEIKMCEDFIKKFNREKDISSAEIFSHRKSTFEELIMSLNIPGFYDEEWLNAMAAA